MGQIYADIENINNDNLALVTGKMIGKEKVHRMKVNMLIYTSAYMHQVAFNLVRACQRVRLSLNLVNYLSYLYQKR